MKIHTFCIVMMFLVMISVYSHDGEGEHEENEFCKVGTRECGNQNLENKPGWIHWVGGLGILSFSLYSGYWYRQKKRKFSSFLQAFFSLVLFLGILWSIAEYYASETDLGVVVCNNEGTECTISIHTHWYLDATVCGERVSLTKEEGDLSEMHTHKDFNRAHFHDTIGYDPVTKEYTEKHRLTIKAFFDQVGVEFTDTCFNGMCNGDICENNDVPGTLQYWVDVTGENKRVDSLEDYIYTDEETIKIVFV